MDLGVTRSIEKRSEDVWTVAKKILRAPADDDARPLGKCVIYHLLRNGSDAARIEQFQSIRWREAAFECAPQKRFKDAINRRIIFPFPLLNRLRRTVGEPCDLLREFVVPQLPAQEVLLSRGDNKRLSGHINYPACCCHGDQVLSCPKF